MCLIEYWNYNPEAFILDQLLEGGKINAWHQQLKGGFHFVFSTGCVLSGVLPLSTEWQKHFQPQWVSWSLTQNASGHARPKETDDQTNRSKRNIYSHTHWKTVSVFLAVCRNTLEQCGWWKGEHIVFSQVALLVFKGWHRPGVCTLFHWACTCCHGDRPFGCQSVKDNSEGVAFTVLAFRLDVFQ